MNVLQASPSPPKLKKTIADDVNQIIYYGRSCVTAQHLDFFLYLLYRHDMLYLNAILVFKNKMWAVCCLV